MGEREFVYALSQLTSVESPSSDLTAVERAMKMLARLGATITGVEPKRVPCPDGPAAMVWRGGPPDAPGRVLLLGHVDTVWPVGTTTRRPFTYENGIATGPGVFDMKGGLLLGLFVLRVLGPDAPVTFLVTGDEEIGSRASREVIEAEAEAARAVLVLEGAAEGGALKSARHGWSMYTLRFSGRAAHAGLEPLEGRNALVRMAEVAIEARALSDAVAGSTVTPTMAWAGHAINTVPDRAELSLDVRAATGEHQRRFDLAIRELAAPANGVSVQVDGGPNRPPMEERVATPLLRRVRDLTERHGLPYPGAMGVGGVSDANFTAALDIPTLDGLGAVGGGAHAEHEWLDIDATLQRTELVTMLLTDLIGRQEVGSNG